MSNYLKHKLGKPIEEVIIKQTSSYREDSGYQKMFKKELDKAVKVSVQCHSSERKHFLTR